MLWSGGHYMFVFVELSLDVSRHGYVKLVSVVIPFQFYAAVQVARPIFDEFIFLPDAFYKVICVLFPNVFDAEVVDDQGEGDWAPFMSPKPRCVCAFIISVGGKALP